MSVNGIGRRKDTALVTSWPRAGDERDQCEQTVGTQYAERQLAASLRTLRSEKILPG